MSIQSKNYYSMQAPKERIDTLREIENQLTTRKSTVRQQSLKQRFLHFVGKQMSVDYQERMVIKSLQAQNVNAKIFFEKLLAQKNNLKNLTNQHLSLLNDKALWRISSIQSQSSFKVFIDKMLTKNIWRWFKPLVEQCTSYFMSLPLLYPESKKIVFWDIIAIVSKLYFLYLIPLELAWSNRKLLFVRYYTSTIVTLIILFVDFMIGLNTAYYKAGSLITNRTQIWHHQLTKLFGLEWISILILAILFLITQYTDIIINVNQNPAYLILLTVLAHQINVHHKTSQYELALNLSKKVSSYLELLKFLLLLFYVIHLFSCLWYWVGTYSQNHYEFNWIDSVKDYGLVDWTDEYLQSFYYICVTMFTIGYGDITPKSGLEKTICIILILISSIQLPYSINTVGSIIEKIKDIGEDTKNKLRTINSYMNKKNVPYNLQNQIRQYLNHYWESLQGQDTDEEKVIIQQLSENLREQLIISANSQIFDKVPLLNKNFSLQLKQNLLKKVQSIQLQPEQIIEQDQNIKCCFVDEGEVDVIIESGQIVQKVKKDETLGLKNLFIGNYTKLQKFKSVGFTKLLILTRQDFLQELKDFPNDYEKFCNIKDDIIFNSDSCKILQHCDSCFLAGHQLTHCPMLHYVPQKDSIIKKNQFPLQQQRKVFVRRHYKLTRFLIEKIDNPDFNDKKQQFIKQYHLPPQQPNFNTQSNPVNPVNTISFQNIIQDDVKEEQAESKEIKLENLRTSVGINQKFNTKRDSLMAVSFIPNDHIQQVKKSIGNNKKVGMTTAQKKQQVDLQLEGMGLQRQNSLASRRQSGALNLINLYQLNFNNPCYKEKYLQELFSNNTQEINFDDDIKQRYEHLKTIKNINPKDRETVELLYIKYTNLQKFNKKGLIEFETIKNYHDYKPLENADRQISKHNKTLNLQLSNLITKYMPYLMYPADFIKRFSLVKSESKKLIAIQEEQF